MKVKDLLKKDIDIDVYDNVCEELGIAFCGPQELTEEGRKHFGRALNLDVELTDKCAIVDVDGPEGEWQKNLRQAKLLFASIAGYCSVENWNKWFVWQ